MACDNLGTNLSIRDDNLSVIGIDIRHWSFGLHTDEPRLVQFDIELQCRQMKLNFSILVSGTMEPAAQTPCQVRRRIDGRDLIEHHYLRSISARARPRSKPLRLIYVLTPCAGKLKRSLNGT